MKVPKEELVVSLFVFLKTYFFPVCRTCIVRYLQTNKFCPTCEVQVHKTRPLVNIRSDQTLQDIVYKLVPGLFKNEMKRRRDFYSQQNAFVQGSIPTSSEKRGDVWGCDRMIFSPEDIISVSIEYCPLNLPMPLTLHPNIYSEGLHPNNETDDKTHRRYLRCPGAITVYHLKKLLRAKYGLNQNEKVSIYFDLATSIY
ncbi:polycomb complex protein BMI-1-like [Stegodyphus dumicola]|uniref:polycomb complex protein BMI-1-like n=1 Tax=Stegodyphus dumicola TaxID=202533 RepID=UPI0015AAFFA5|nr:polycomb complex protein BMI-1-like [Stegodyphus dumicola]